MFELVLLSPLELAERVSDILVEELEALSVALEDAESGSADEQAIFGEPGMPVPQAGWRHSIVRALFDDERSAEQAATRLLAQSWSSGLHAQSLRLVKDEDWVRLTQSQFDPIEVAPGFWIVPSWHQPAVDASCVIRLDPGLAFGTGTHPTTSMCLRWIARCAQDWPRVLDYGCGSGILGIGAAMHGARSVDAVDLDAAAIEAARANARSNDVRLNVGRPDLAQGRYALVLANILATPLRLLAPLLCAHVDAGGWLVLSGILERQLDELKAAYAPWLTLEAVDRQEGWVLMAGQRMA